MEPINYMLDIQSPLQQALTGYGLGRQDIEQRQIMDERSQMMDLRAAQEARVAAAEEERRAAAAQARAKADAMQAQLVALHEQAMNGTLTVDALNQFSLANAETFADFTTAFKQMEADKSRPQVQFAIETTIPALSGNPERALAIIDERIAAAENAGEMQEAKALRADRAILEANPRAYGVSSLSMLVATGAIDNAQADTILKLSGQGAETTEAVRTLQQRAELAGLMPGTPEYNQFMVSGGKPPEGMAIRTTPEGGIEFIQGAGAATPFREQESKDIVFAARAEGALAALDPVADQLANVAPRLLEYVPLGQGRKFQDPLFQVANNAGLEFLAAILRKDTGAAITAQEIEIYGQTYLPQPGDSPEALAQKKEARSRALRALQAPMRPEATEAVSGAVEGETPAPAPAAPTAAFISNPTVQRLVRENASVGVTAESIWNAMTAKERAEYGG
jgi:hypothetical protein